jgi:UDP-glucose 4-epimerase
MATDTLLVTGGAGFVGSHAVRELVDRGFDIVVADNLNQGHIAAVHPKVELVQIDLADRAALGRLFERRKLSGVMHFAASSLVGESMAKPFLYLRDNVVNALNLIECCVEHDVKRFVLSSTANLFGLPDRIPIDEDAAIDPGSPYGESKYAIERALLWADRVHGLRSACLRYFNAAGAHPDGSLGEDHHPETHLIPLVLDAAAGRRPHIEIYGTDYPTPDGTCIRDYVHICDLAVAHALVLDVLKERSCRYNLGNGRGYSVREVIAAVRRVTGCDLLVREGGRRPGDPPVLVASSNRIRTELGWVPRFPELETIVAHAWGWRRRNPAGYDRSNEERRNIQ